MAAFYNAEKSDITKENYVPGPELGSGHFSVLVSCYYVLYTLARY